MYIEFKKYIEALVSLNTYNIIELNCSDCYWYIWASYMIAALEREMTLEIRKQKFFSLSKPINKHC